MDEAIQDEVIKDEVALVETVDGQEGRCSYCSQSLTGSDEVACARCQTVYHRSCWESYHKCAVYGCLSRVYVIKELPSSEKPEDKSLKELEDNEDETQGLIEFDRSNFYIYVVFAAIGMFGGVLLTFFPLILLMVSGIIDKYFLYNILGPNAPELLYILSNFMGGLIAALPARERFTMNFRTGKLEAAVTWMGRSLLSFELNSLDELNGLAVEENDGRLWAYYALSPSVAKQSAGLSIRSLFEYTAQQVHTFRGRTLLSMGPKVGDKEGVRQWLVTLEEVAIRLDKSLLLPKCNTCIELLAEQPLPLEIEQEDAKEQREDKLAVATKEV